jgi:hypothetical protein
MDVPVHAHEHFLDQVFSALTITRRAIHEIQQTILVPVDQLVESTLLTFEESTHYPTIVQLAKSLSRSRTRRNFNRTKSCVSHDPLRVGEPPPKPSFPLHRHQLLEHMLRHSPCRSCVTLGLTTEVSV